MKLVYLTLIIVQIISKAFTITTRTTKSCSKGEIPGELMITRFKKLTFFPAFDGKKFNTNPKTYDVCLQHEGLIVRKDNKKIVSSLRRRLLTKTFCHAVYDFGRKSPLNDAVVLCTQKNPGHFSKHNINNFCIVFFADIGNGITLIKWYRKFVKDNKMEDHCKLEESWLDWFKPFCKKP